MTYLDPRATIEDFFQEIGMGPLWFNVEEMSFFSGKRPVSSVIEAMPKDLDPNNDYWSQFASQVRQALPGGLVDLHEDHEDYDFYRNIHQFRYIIDAYQVGYIRDRYYGETDEEKLQSYIRDEGLVQGFDWDFESARLHNKLCGPEDLDSSYPDGTINANIKVLICNGFHSEFIIDSKGHFLYVLDEEAVRKSLVYGPGGSISDIRNSAVINGASFNYACNNDYKGKLAEALMPSNHGKYDISPVKEYDPSFRRDAMTGFRALDNGESVFGNLRYKKSDLYKRVLERESFF